METENSRKIMNKIEKFEEPLEQPGKIFLAEIHGSAQRLLKVKRLSKYIRFCQCCLLPSETPGVVMPYTCLDNRKEYGLGIHLYFYYIQFCLIITFISFCLSSIPTMVFSIRYTNHLTEHCKNYYYDNNNTLNNSNDTNIIYNPEFITNNTNCLKYLSSDKNKEVTVDLTNIIQKDWILKMSTDNIKNYYEIFKEKAKDPNNINNVLLDFSFLYFLTSIVLLIINFLYIHYVNVLNDKEDLEETSPRDYTILVHGVEKSKENKEISRKEHLQLLLNEISNNYFKLDIYEIIPCYTLIQLYRLTKKVFEDKVKIYHAHNFKRQKDLHEKYLKNSTSNIGLFQGLNINNSVKINDITYQNSQLSKMIKTNNDNLGINQNINSNQDNLNYYTKFLCYIKATPLKEIEERINLNKEKIKEIERDINENPDKYNSGTYFVVFKYISMRDKIYSFFPTNLSSKIFMKIKYLFQNILCGCCTNEKTKRTNYLKTAFTIEHATEAYEVLWENLGYSFRQRYFYILLSGIATILLIGASFCIVIGLNEAQYKITEEGENNIFLRYFISFLISITIAIINSLGRLILRVITQKFEAIETRTDYYISLSIKISVFTFINTNLVPLFSNYIFRKWGDNDILLNNILMIFITNITLTPFVFYFGPKFCLKLSRRAKARLDLQGIPLADSKYTQRELNKIFENPKMELSYKYSYLVNILLTSLFYMSIFPLGTVFCIVALIFCYFLEIFYLGFYRRPELLNPRLCKFFIQNFKIVISVFCIGNFIFLSSISEYYRTNWTLINLILFIILAFIPYHSLKINLLGITEGETTKGSYDEYALMFPTDYEKENPLTKKRAMIKHFNKLREMNIIDKYQCDFLIKKIQKESIMDNYYKNSRNVGKVLGSYEFQRQFVQLKKKYKFIRDVRRKQSQLNKYNFDIDEEIRKRGYSTHSKMNQFRSRQSIRKKTDISNYINDEDSQNHDINLLIGTNALRNRRLTSAYIRKSLFKRIKDEGIYSESEEEESETDSYDIDNLENYEKGSNKNDILEFDHSSNGENKNSIIYSEKNKTNEKDIHTIKEDEKEEESSSSVDTKYKDYVKQLKRSGFFENNNTETNVLNKDLKKRTISSENILKDTTNKL